MENEAREKLDERPEERVREREKGRVERQCLGDGVRSREVRILLNKTVRAIGHLRDEGLWL